MSEAEAQGSPEIAERVRRYRAERGWTQAELARRAGVSRGTVSRIELALERPLGRTARSLAAALGVEVERLLGALGQAALFPSPDELRLDLVRRILELRDVDVERAHAACRAALEDARQPRPPRRRGSPKKGDL